MEGVGSVLKKMWILLDNIVDIIGMLSIIILVIIGVFSLAKQEDPEPKQDYNLELYKDEQTGITMMVFTDKMGDVIYCEPVVVDIKKGINDED